MQVAAALQSKEGSGGSISDHGSFSKPDPCSSSSPLTSLGTKLQKGKRMLTILPRPRALHPYMAFKLKGSYPKPTTPLCWLLGRWTWSL